MLKKLALLVALMYGSVLAQQTAGTTGTELVPGQIYNTGNIVLPTVSGSNTTPWVNGVYQNSLTCWYGGDPGYCGPNAIVRPGNNINFSYGFTDLLQSRAIASVLPNSGTGLNVNGYNFGFYAKNGNGWDDGRTDALTAYVHVTNTAGQAVEYKTYNLNYKFDWTAFNYSETFNTPYASKDLANVTYGFYGYDKNFWAGPYGPEIYNVSFSLKYSVDPCATNPMYSPTCPGYLDALAKLLPATTTVADPVTATTSIMVEPTVATIPTTSVSTGKVSVVADVVSAPAPTTQSSTSTSQTTKESSSSSSNTSLALSIISKNSDRDAAGAAVAQTAVAQAQAAANQAQQEAQSVAASAVANSTTNNAASSGSQSSGNGIRVNNNNSNSTNFTLQSGLTSLASAVGGPQTSNTTLVQQQNSNGTGLNVANNQPVTVVNTGQQSSTDTVVATYTLPLLQPQVPNSVLAPIMFTPVEQQQVQQQTVLQSSGSSTQSIDSYAIVPPNFLTDKSNPLTDIIEGKNTVPQNSTIATTGPSVNKNTGDNEVAGGVDINKMALAPVGYGDYLNLVLRDAAFYAPKEVYRNQRNVDNARALRQLSSDSKHREMVEQQYAK